MGLHDSFYYSEDYGNSSVFIIVGNLLETIFLGTYASLGSKVGFNGSVYTASVTLSIPFTLSATLSSDSISQSFGSVGYLSIGKREFINDSSLIILNGVNLFGVDFFG